MNAIQFQAYLRSLHILNSLPASARISSLAGAEFEYRTSLNRAARSSRPAEPFSPAPIVEPGAAKPERSKPNA